MTGRIAGVTLLLVVVACGSRSTLRASEGTLADAAAEAQPPADADADAVDAGACVPPSADCNEDIADGCEVFLSIDPQNCGACGRSCLGGECQSGLCSAVVIASGQDAPLPIAVDETHVYWANAPQNSDFGELLSWHKESGTFGELAAPLREPVALALDETHLYLATRDKLYAMSKPGGALELLAEAQTLVADLAVDSTTLYFTRGGTAPAVASLPKSGGAISELLPLKPGRSFLTLLGNDLVVASGAGTTGQVLRVAKSGGTPQVLVDGLGLVGPVVTAGDNIVFSTRTKNGFIATLGPSGSVTTLTAAENALFDIVNDGQSVFYTVREDAVADGKVRRVPLAGGAAQTLAAEQATPSGIAEDGQALYWTNTSDGTVMRMAK